MKESDGQESNWFNLRSNLTNLTRSDQLIKDLI